MTVRVVGFITLASASIDIELTSPVLAQSTVSLTDGDYFPDELAAHIQTQVRAEHANYAAFTCTVSATTGIFSMALTGSDTGVITWTTPGGDLRDWMRYSGATENLSSTATSGSRVHKSGLYPVYGAIEDLPRKVTHATQSVSDNGQVHTVSYATRTEHDLTLYFNGGPRDDTYREWHAFEDLVVNHIAHGKRFRYYASTGVSSAYAAVTTPKGYHTFVAEVPFDWDPEPQQDGWYEVFQLGLHCYEYQS